MLTLYGSDPILVDAAISSLKGMEGEVLQEVEAKTTVATADAVSMLAAAVAKSGDVTAVQQVLTRATDAATPAAQRTALLQGLDAGLPGTGGRGGRGGGGRGAAPAKPVALAAEPTALMKLMSASGDEGAMAKRLVSKLEWPGKPAPVNEAPPLTSAEQKRFDAGADLYKNICIGCHQPDGRGKEKIAPPLVESRYAIGPDSTQAMRILLAGKEGPVGLMPPLGGALNDEQIASVLTYIRREWGNTGTPVVADDVTEVRGLTKTRTRPWTDAELTAGRGGRGGRGVQ
jgi:mono/diheme cytochrome c family protein